MSKEQPLIGTQQQPQSDHVDVYNVVVVSLSFMLLFTAYNTLQNFVTSLLPSGYGNISIGVLYVTTVIVIFTTPFVVRVMGEKLGMICGGACFILYMIALAITRTNLVVIVCMSVVIGIGASVIWVAVGSFLVQCSAPSKRAWVMGTFWGVFQICNVIGNLMAWFVLHTWSHAKLFITFVVVGGAGVTLFIFLRPLRIATAKPPQTPLLQSMRNVLVLTVRRDMLLLVPIYFWTGLELGFWTGEFPQLLKPTHIGAVLMFVGIGEVVGSAITSRFTNNANLNTDSSSLRQYTCSIFVILGTLCFIGALLLSVLLRNVDVFSVADDNSMHIGVKDGTAIVAGVPWFSVVAALLFGFGDSFQNSQIFAILGHLSSDGSGEHTSEDDAGINHSSAGFTVFQLFNNLGAAVGFLWGLPHALPFADRVVYSHSTHSHVIKHGTMWQIGVQLVVLCIACVGFVAADVGRLHKTKRLESGLQVREVLP